MSDGADEVCVVMTSAIGDAVHVLPVVSALRRAWPDTRLTWVIQPLPHLLARGHPAVDEFVVYRRRRGLTWWEGFAEFAREVGDRRFDLVIDLQVSFKAGILTHLLQAPRKLGYDFSRARDLNWLFTTERIPTGPMRHVQDQYFDFLHHLGVDPEPVVWHVPITPAEREAQRRFFDRLGAPGCAVVVGTSKREKNWTAEGYARVIEEVEERYGLRPILVGGPSSLEREIADRILATTRVDAVDTLGDDLRRLIWILEGSALTISPDTGPLHISRAVETPVVGLYGYTNPKRTGPYGKYDDLVVDGYARYPDEDYPISREYRDGMRRVSVEAVLEKVERAVRTYL